MWTPQLFRKEKLLRQKELCIIGYNNMLNKGGFEVEKTDENTVFSPYQLIPETCVNWFLEKDIRKPPMSMIQKVQVINSQISGHELRLKPTFFSHKDYERFIKKHINKSSLIYEIITERDKGTDKEVFIKSLCERHKQSDKSVFYPFVRSLFKAMGIISHGGAGRIDELLEYNNIKIPAEIKSYSETATYNMKGARQSLENKIIVSTKPQDLNYASLLIGYNHPSSTNEIQEFMDAVFEELKIKIIAFDLHTIVTMCVNTIWDKQSVNFEDLFRKYGIAEV